MNISVLSIYLISPLDISQFITEMQFIYLMFKYRHGRILELIIVHLQLHKQKWIRNIMKKKYSWLHIPMSSLAENQECAEMLKYFTWICLKILDFFPCGAHKENNMFIYSPFHKTLPRSSLQMHLISVRFYEMGDSSLLIEYLTYIHISANS